MICYFRNTEFVAMKCYETSAMVEEQGQVHLAGVPFAPGTEINVTISPKQPVAEGVSAAGDQALAAARARMQELFGMVKGFRMAPKIPREELYDRGGFR